jgi:hypothetical protein
MRRGFAFVETLGVASLAGAATLAAVSTGTAWLSESGVRAVAGDFVGHLDACRALALETGRQCRVLLVDYDASPADPTAPGVGEYWVQLGDDASASTSWDTLPVGEGARAGVVRLQEDRSGVSLEAWGGMSGPGSGNGDAIVFGPDGKVSNPASDFDANGRLKVRFAQKRSTLGPVHRVIEVAIGREA